MLRINGEFGPIGALGHSHQCLRLNNHWVGAFANLDSSFTKAENIVAVDLGSRARVVSPFDTGAFVSLERAEMSAQRLGAKDYQSASRRYAPVSMRFDGDTIEVWLIPASLIMGAEPTVGGERGYVFTPDGRQLLRQIDSFASYRAISVPDSGQVRIVSSEAVIPTLSEFTLANALHDSGRSVAIVHGNVTSILVHSPGGDTWMHLVDFK